MSDVEIPKPMDPRLREMEKYAGWMERRSAAFALAAHRHFRLVAGKEPKA